MVALLAGVPSMLMSDLVLGIMIGIPVGGLLHAWMQALVPVLIRHGWR